MSSEAGPDQDPEELPKAPGLSLDMASDGLLGMCCENLQGLFTERAEGQLGSELTAEGSMS